MQDFLEKAFVLGMLAVVFIILIGVPILAIRIRRPKPEKKFRKVFDGVEFNNANGPGLVELRYHTYDGILMWFVQTEHHIYLKPNDAREVLRRMLRYNLSWGLLAAGGLLVPLVAIPSYFGQKKTIASQEAELLKISTN